VEVETTNCTNHRTTENKRQKKSGEQLSVRTALRNSKQKHRNGNVLVLTKSKNEQLGIPKKEGMAQQELHSVHTCLR